LFDGRPWLVCPEGADPDAVQTVEAWARDVGATIVQLSAAEHDAAVARTSHLPRLVASALVRVVDDAGATAAGGPAFERLVRTAGGPEAMWRDIFESNADEIARAILELSAVLEPIARELAGNASTEKAEALLHAAGQLRAELARASALAGVPAADRAD
jgi:prephenate dehydrogenase